MDRRVVLKALSAGAIGLSAAALVPARAFARKSENGPLPIPKLLEGRLLDGVRVYDLKMGRGETSFFNTVKTPTLGINEQNLGSTLKLRVGEKVRLNVTNEIGEPTTLHWHGLHLPAKADGGPHQTVMPDKTWSPEFEVKQLASTFWYHSHMHEKTGEQVWHGLAGMLIVEDDLSDKLDLPRDYGVDDIPVILQDRAFTNDGRLFYGQNMHNIMMGMQGDASVANGKVFPHFVAKTKKIRLRLLNGSNASFYNLGFDDNRPFHQITGDGSFLESPVKQNRILLGPAERAEIIVDVSDGRDIKLISDGNTNRARGMGGMMGRGRGMMGGMMRGDNGREFLQIVANGNLKNSLDLPTNLLNLERLNPAEAIKTRRFALEMTMGPTAMMGIANPVSINGKVMDMGRIDEVVKLGSTEIWEISNGSPLPHPFHIHDIQFQILDRSGHAPMPGERGMKDTVTVNSGETVRVIARFEDYADQNLPFMYHCHILEHEDAGMMGQFTVVA